MTRQGIGSKLDEELKKELVSLKAAERKPSDLSAERKDLLKTIHDRLQVELPIIVKRLRGRGVVMKVKKSALDTFFGCAVSFQCTQHVNCGCPFNGGTVSLWL